jgi:hypothetical protein
MRNILKNVFLNFTYFIFLPFIKLDCPTGLPVTNSSECYKWETDSIQCCLLSSKKSDSICYPFIGKNLIPTTQVYGFIEYNVICLKSNSTSDLKPPVIIPTQNTNISLPLFDIPSESNFYGLGLSNCGKPNPQSLKDCSIDSTATQSCCYYSYLQKNGCFWVSFKADDSKISKTQQTAFALTCSSKYIEYIHILIFLFTLLFI